MQKYKDFAPTGFDAKGLIAERYDIGEFLVVIGRNRDSDTLEESNWIQALEMLGGESDTVQVHRFGHWACGWLEVLMIDPADEKASAIAQEIKDRLADYPILNEEHYSRLQWERAAEYWDSLSLSSRADELRRNSESIFAARADYGDLSDRAPRTAEKIAEE